MLEKQVVTIGLSGGLDNKTDEKLVGPDKSLDLFNARFYKAGRLSKRFGVAPLTVETDGPDINTLNPSAILTDGKMLGAITDSGVYCFYESENQWKLSSTFNQPISVVSDFYSKGSTQEIGSDADFIYGKYAAVFLQLANAANQIALAIEDKETGSRKSVSIFVNSITQRSCPRVRILGTASNPFYHVFIPTQSGLVHRIYDKNLAQIATNTIGSLNFDTSGFDIYRYGGTIYLATINTDALSLYSFTQSGGITPANTSSYTLLGGNYGTDTSSGCGFSICADSNNLVVAYADANSTGEISLVSFTTSFSLVQARKTVTTSSGSKMVSLIIDGTYAYVASSTKESLSSTIGSRLVLDTISYTTSAASINTISIFRPRILARPFVLNGNVYCPCHMPESAQMNGYIVNFSDGNVYQKFSINSVYSHESLSIPLFQVANSPIIDSDSAAIFYDSYYGADTQSVNEPALNFVGIKRTLFNVPSMAGNRFKLGESIYYTSGLTMEFDGTSFFESGFFQNPDTPVTIAIPGTAVPGISSKTFSYRAVYAAFDAKGQLTMSTPSLLTTIGPTGAETSRIDVSIKFPFGSLRKQVASGITESMIMLFRTTNGGKTFYKVATQTLIGNNGGTTTISDTTSDADLVNNQILYTTGNVLANDQAPSATFSVSGGNRLFLGGLEEKNEIAFSKKQLFAESVGFSDFFRVRVSSATRADNSSLGALGYMDGKLIIFRENSLSYIQGDGPNEIGANDTFTDPEVISSDTGCNSPRSVLNIPTGLMFKSKKGIYLLDRSLQVSYVGSPVESYNELEIASSVLHEKFNEARFYTSNNTCLVYNYLFDQWSIFEDQADKDSDNWKGNPVFISGNKLFKEVEGSFTDDSVGYSVTAKTPWIKLSGLQDFGRIWSAIILGTYKSAHSLQVKVYYDYSTDYVETFTITPQASDAQYQYRIHLKKQKCEAIQFEILDLAPIGESMDLSAITLEVGLRKGSMKLAASRKY